MKLPFPKDEHHKRMSTASEGTVGRDVLFDLSDPAVITNGNGHTHTNGNGYPPCLMVDKAVQYEMETSNDATDFARESQSNHTPQEERVLSPQWSPSALNETIPVHAKQDASTDDTIKAWRKEVDSVTSSSETQQKPPQQPPNADDGARCKINNDSYPTARDDDNHEHNNTNTWRVRDRNRNSSGSEDEIEKISESALDVRGGGERDKSTPTEDRRCGQENNRTSPSTSKPGQPRNQDDEGEDCLIQCLSYTLQCCECVIS